MKYRLGGLVSLLLLVIPAPVFAKADISRITITSANLTAPIEITDRKILANFDLWGGPGTSWTGGSPERANNFIVDWSRRLAGPPKGLQRYEVSFYSKMPNERLVYVAFYEYDPSTQRGYVYLPGTNDEWYRLNVSTILRGVEGRWFHAWSGWDRVAGPLISAVR